MSSNNKIEFFDYHKPILEDGGYALQLIQTLGLKDYSSSTAADVSQIYKSEVIEFHVSGPRFNLETSLIHSVYPPVGAKGDYLADLPSLVLNRSTLPWERIPSNVEVDTNSGSWLFLLLLDESEITKIKEHKGASINDMLTVNYGDNKNDPVVNNNELSRLPKSLDYLEIPPASKANDFDITAILPATINDLQYLCYTRIKTANKDIPQDSGEEKAVLLCNRLPKRGSNSTVFLLSIENNYTGNDGNAVFQGIKNASGNYIFPYLYKWQFHSFDDRLYCITESNASTINNELSNKTPGFTPIDFSAIYGKIYVNKDDFEAALADFNITDNDTMNTIVSDAVFNFQLTQEIADKFPEISEIATLVGNTWKTKSDLTTSLNNIGINDNSTILYIENLAKLPGTTFHGLLSNLQGGFEPYSLDIKALDLSQTGSVNLTFDKTSGKTTDSTKAWYRGPFAGGGIDLKGTGLEYLNYPVITSIGAEFSISNFPSGTTFNSSDESIATVQNGIIKGIAEGNCIINCSFDQQETEFNVLVVENVSQGNLNTAPENSAILKLAIGTGDIDLSYAAAFELGRLTALNDVDFSTEFYKWKSETAMAIRLNKSQNDSGHLVVKNKSVINYFPQHLIDKFNAWKNLEGIPYRYLIPDIELLPNESIRFFQLDNNWINAFVCGAFSIGHTVEADLSFYLNCLFENKNKTGFLINSLVVSGWPDFQLNITPAVGNTIKLLRKDNLDVNIKLFLFSDPFSELEFHLHPGKLHSGFLWEDEKFMKVDDTIDLTAEISDINVINIPGILQSDLLNSVQSPIPVSEFASKMMEGIPMVKFSISG